MPINRRLLGVSALLIANAVIGCERESVPRESTGQFEVVIDTVDGTIRVENRGDPPRSTLEETVSIESEEFGRIVSVISDDDGKMYVGDELASQIHVFDPDGQFLYSIGREGEGPGEFQRLISIAWVGDTIAALDAGTGRLGFLARDGEWLGQRPYMAYAGTGVRLYPTAPDEVYMPLVRVVQDQVEPVLVRQLNSGPADTLPNPPDSRERDLAVTCLYNGGEQGITTYQVPDSPRLIRVPAPGVELVEIWSSDYQILFVSSGGNPIRIVERDLPRFQWEASDWRTEVEAFEEFVQRYPGTTCEPRRLPQLEAKERIRGVVFDDASRMWVEWVDAQGSPFLDVFDAEGRLIAQVASVPRLSRVPLYVRGDQVYIVVTNDLGVETVKVFRLHDG